MIDELLEAERTERTMAVSALEFDVLTEHVGLTSPPLVLKVPSPGRTHTERAELVAEAWRSLRARELADGADVDPELRRLLRLLSSPAREVDGRLWLGRSVRVLAAADADSDSASAVLAVKDDDRVSLRSAAASGLAREACSVLAPAPAGPGRSVSLRSQELDESARQASDDPEDLRRALQQRGIRSDDAETLTRMVAATGFRGQFGVAVRDRLGRRHRAQRVVGVFDTAHGRYVQSRRESPSGEAWSTIAPVDQRRLVAHVEELLDDTADLS